MEMMQTLAERIGPKGEIKLPKHVLEALGVKIGEEVILAIKVVIKPAQNLTGKIVESEEWL